MGGGRKKNKDKTKQRSGNQSSRTNARKMEDDAENPQDGFKDGKTSRWSYIRHPSMIIDAITSGIIWIQVFVYQKCAGRMPLFIKSTADGQEQQVKKHITITDELKRENLRVKDTISELEKHNEIIEEEKSNLQKENLELRDTNSDLEQNNKTLEEERNDMKVMTETLTKENQQQQESNKGLLNDKNLLEQANEDKRKRNELLERENASYREVNDTHKRQNYELTEEFSKQDELIRNQELNIKMQACEIDQADTCIKSLQQEIHNFTITLGDKERIIQELCENMIKLTAEKKILEGEKQDALRRLSEQVSVKLRDNNPNIVDLSDPCRATKLAEMFGELYDNEWTNAFSVLEDNFTEEKAIVVLLDAVMLAYNFCERRVEEPWKTLEDWFLDKNLSGNQQTSKWLKDSRKVNIQKKVPEIEKIFTENVSRICGDEKLKALLSVDKDLTSYFTKCIEVCLLMVTTDPPVVLVCPGWNVIQIEVLPSQLQEEGDRHSCSKPSDEHSNVSQNTADGNSDFSKESTETEENTTQLDRSQDLMDDTNNKIADNGNSEEGQANYQQEIQGQHESGPQGNDDPDEYTSYDGHDLKDRNSASEEFANSGRLNDKSTNALLDESQLNEDNSTGTLKSLDLTNEKDKDENKMTYHARDSPEHLGHYGNIDNSTMFDVDDHQMTQQDESSNQTPEKKAEEQSSEDTTAADIMDQQMKEKRNEENEGSRQVFNENGNIKMDKTQSEEQQTKHADLLNENHQMTQQDESSNQTTEKKAEEQSSENTTVANIMDQQIEEKRNEENEGSRQVLNENGNIEMDKTQSEEQQTKHADLLNENENLLPHARSGNTSVENSTITSDELCDKSNGGLKGKGDESTNIEIQKFDKDLFKEYTCRGEFQDYVVWPAMRLHEDGPLLSKGVAQGSKNENKINNDIAWTWIHHK